MSNNSLFVKITIWFMIFLMSVGFAALVIAPFAGTSLFGGGGGREATEELVAEARADIKKDNCADEDAKLSGAQLERCKEALKQLASAYTTLARPEEVATADEQPEMPRDAQRNIDRAGAAFKRLYVIDKSDQDSAALYGGFLRQVGDTEEALAVWNALVKAHPRNEDYLLNKAGAHQQLQQFDEAIRTLRLYLKRFPDAGQAESVQEEIKNIQEQQKQQAEGGAAGAGNLPISIN
jgi:tetratricopeptide (TPR) repeat protein